MVGPARAAPSRLTEGSRPYAGLSLGRGRCGGRGRKRAVQLCPAASLGPVRDVELAIDVRQMELDRLLGHPQHPRQLRVRVTFRDEPQYFELATRELWRIGNRQRLAPRRPVDRLRQIDR